MRTEPDVLSKFITALSRMRRGGGSSNAKPHKPLLLLHALAKIEHGDTSSCSLTEVREVLTPLLATYSDGKSSPRPEQPFWRLQRDGLWEVKGADALPTTRSGDVIVSAVTDSNTGQLPSIYLELFTKDAKARRTAIDGVAALLPSSSRSNALDAFGLR